MISVVLPELRSATSTRVLVVAYKHTVSKKQVVSACEAPVRVPESIKVPLHP